MSDFKYNLATRDGEPESLLIFSGKTSLTATPENPGFRDAVLMVTAPGTTFEQLTAKLSLAVAVDTEFKRLSERVTVRGGNVYFDGDKVHGALSKAIVDFFVSGAGDYMALVNFMEKVNTNPEPHSREQLYEWLNRFHFGIAPDGDIIAYKGLNRKYHDADKAAWESSSSGSAIVNGKPYEGCIPAFPGAIIEMPRSEVNHDPTTGCSTGLHVGNWDYAKSFAQVTVRVKVNPRDVCSVPTDSGWQKVRCCRYQILGLVDAEDSGVLFVPDVYKTLCASALDPSAPTYIHQDTTVFVEEKPKRKPRSAKATPIKGKGRKARTVTPPVKTVSKKVQPMTGKPLFYEDMMKIDLANVSFNELRWVAKEWAIKGLSSRPTKQELVSKLATAAAARRRKAKGTKNYQKTYTPTTR